MPLNRYFGGHGEEVMAELVRKHGAEKAKHIFYGRVNNEKKRGHFPRLKREQR